MYHIEDNTVQTEAMCMCEEEETLSLKQMEIWLIYSIAFITWYERNSNFHSSYRPIIENLATYHIKYRGVIH